MVELPGISPLSVLHWRNTPKVKEAMKAFARADTFVSQSVFHCDTSRQELRVVVESASSVYQVDSQQRNKHSLSVVVQFTVNDIVAGCEKT
jgi:phosphoenolpyruvate carboxylase